MMLPIAHPFRSRRHSAFHYASTIMRPHRTILRQRTEMHPDHRRPDALHCPSYVSFVRHSCVTCAALMCHNSIFHAFSRIVTHESAEMRLGNHPDQPLHPPIAPPRHALQPASALNPLQPSRTAFAALTGIALITALMSPRVSRSVLRAASTIFGSESVQCSTKSAILPYPAAAKIP